MALTNTDAKKVFYRVVRIALIVCVWAVILANPLKPYILPFLKQFVDAHQDFLINTLWYVFITCSFSLTLLLYWIFAENKKFRIATGKYLKKLIAKDYYKEDKKVDLEHFMAGAAVREQSTRTIETDSEVGEQKDSGVRKEDEGHPLDDLGTSDGMHRTFFKNGRVKSEANYKNGKLDGVLRTYYEEGLLHQEKYYRDGKLNGIFKAYDENGVPYFEIHYKDDKQEGLDKTFYKNGVIQYEDTYQDGTHIKRKTFDEGGSLVFEEDYTEENAPEPWR